MARILHVLLAVRRSGSSTHRAVKHLADAIGADARPAERGSSSMHKPVLAVTAYFVDAVEARLKQEFELRRKQDGARFTPGGTALGRRRGGCDVGHSGRQTGHRFLYSRRFLRQ